jgi:hypothetical protein
MPATADQAPPAPQDTGDEADGASAPGSAAGPAGHVLRRDLRDTVESLQQWLDLSA